MASTNEIAQIDAINKGLTQLNGTLNTTAASYMTLIKTIESGNAVINETAKTEENLSKAKKKTVETTKEQDALNKQLAASAEKLKTFDAAVYEQIQRNTKALTDQKKAINDKIKAGESEEGSLVRMRQKLKELTDQYDKAGTRTKEAAKEIDNLSREIGKAEAATNRHQRGVGGYADQLGKLPGPIGGAVSSLAGFSKTLWLLIANPIGAVIAGIVAAFAALGSVFASTASGGKLVKEVMASVGAIFDVIKQSTILVIDGFKALFSGEFSKAGQLFGDSMRNLKNNTADAAKAAWALVDAQSALNKELAFHISEEADETNVIQKALMMSKDKTKSDKERLELLKLAMSTSEEQAKKAEEFAKRQFIIDSQEAERKTKIAGLTAEQIQSFIKMSSEEQLIALNTNNQLKKTYDILGKDGITKLEESYAKVVNANTEFYSANKRTTSQLSTLQNELSSDNEKRIKDEFDKKVAAVEYANSVQKELINKSHIDGITSEEEYKSQLQTQEIAFLTSKQSLYKQDSKEYQNIELEKQSIAIKTQDDILKALEDRLKLQKSTEEDYLKDSEKLVEDQQKLEEKKADDAIREGERLAEAKKKIDEDYAEAVKKSEEDIKNIKIDMAQMVINEMFDRGKSKRDEELADLEKKKDKELSNKNLTEAQKEKIEAEYQKKANAIKLKQAKQDKVQAMFNIALDTFKGSMAAAAIPPLFAANPMIPWLIAMGAVQAALVAAQPLPKFAKGTNFAPERGLFGEAGRELMILRSGDIGLAEKATYFEGSKFKGAKIFSNPETEKIIGTSDRGLQGQSLSDERIIAGLERLNTTIKNKPVIIQDKEYRQIGLQYDNHKEVYLNRLINRNV